MSFRRSDMGIATHSSCRACRRSCTEVGAGVLFLIRLSSSAQTCSIGFKSGDCVGQTRCLTAEACSRNQFCTFLARWIGALSSCKSAFSGEGSWPIPGKRFSSSSERYSCDVTEEGKITRGHFLCQLNAPQTITPPPNACVVGETAPGIRVSFGLLHARACPPFGKTVNLDSSDQIASFH
jgi:hypothetical protein